MEKKGYIPRSFNMGDHSTTPINAPKSFYADGIGIDGSQKQDLVRPAPVIDVRAKYSEARTYTTPSLDQITVKTVLLG
ncbi:cyclase family protein [Pseudomonas sp. FP2309]|uniref:cyclase family protein n=1 Tax=Pseudomonas sp. FP2309 TaxID=2954091 RepID=UPI0027342B8B|nr:cyclase family protein [Pseudomonas sp. FP2309]WLH67822.1 hypothetical protein PSH59_22370 [Pseudomonas sp. FP2309]